MTFFRELIGRLQFLNMCVKESLRLHPPVWGINRKAAKPITLPDGRTLPAGQRPANTIRFYIFTCLGLITLLNDYAVLNRCCLSITAEI